MARDPNRRHTIIDGASQLFLRHGYDGVTVDEICTQTHSSKGSFYHFFSSKEDLAIQLIDDTWDATQESLADTFSADKSPMDRIRDELVHAYSRSHTMDGRSRHMTGSPIGTLSVTFGNKSEKIRKRINFAFNHMRHTYRLTFTEAISKGDLDGSRSAAELADLLLVTIQGIGIIGRATNSRAKTRRLVDNLMSAFGINSSPSP